MGLYISGICPPVPGKDGESVALKILCGKGLPLPAQSHAVFNGQAFNILQLDGTGGNLIGQQFFQNTGCLLGDDGANAVTIDNANGNNLLSRKVCFFCVFYVLLDKIRNGFKLSNGCISFACRFRCRLDFV